MYAPLGYVLVIENAIEHQKSMLSALRSAGLLVDAVSTSDEARKRIIANGIALVILDTELPSGDGISLAHWIKATHKDIPVILVSSDESFTHDHLVFSTISKPVIPRVLADVVRDTLSMALIYRRLDKQDGALERIEKFMVGNTLLSQFNKLIKNPLFVTISSGITAFIAWLIRHGRL